MNKMSFDGMKDAAQQIESLAILLRMAAETGQLDDGGTITEDVVTLIQEKAHELGRMISEAENAAQ